MKNKAQTIIISAFPACGKSTYTENNKYKNDLIVDLESSEFSKLPNGCSNPYFVYDYVNAIKETIGKYEIVFISSHIDVRKQLMRESIPYVFIKPIYQIKKHWFNRIKNREIQTNSTDYISSVVNENWDYFNKTLENEKVITLNYDEYIHDTIISNAINYVYIN